jgi:hypothetical protein
MKVNMLFFNNILSDVHSQENGILQGAILSLNLFLIALRSITSYNGICRRLDNLFSARKHGGHTDETAVDNLENVSERLPFFTN